MITVQCIDIDNNDPVTAEVSLNGRIEFIIDSPQKVARVRVVISLGKLIELTQLAAKLPLENAAQTMKAPSA